MCSEWSSDHNAAMTTVSARTRLLGTAHVERANLAWFGALRGLVVYQALVLTLLLTGYKTLALPVAVGVLFASLGDAGEDVGRRWRTMLWTTLWISVTTFLGGIASNWIVASVVLVVVVALVCGMAGMLGPRAALIGVLSLVCYTIFNGAPDSDRIIAEDVLGMFIGGITVTVVMVLPHLWDKADWRAASVSVPGIRARLSGQFDPRNDLFRHGVRLAIIIGLATLISDLTSYPHDYWLPMTVAWVTKPDKDGTSTRIIERIVGTIVGVLVTALVVDVLHFNDVLIAIFAGLGSALAVLFVRANYSIAVAGVTMLVVGLFTFDGDPVGETIVLRIILTIAAGVMAFMAFYIWPPVARTAK